MKYRILRVFILASIVGLGILIVPRHEAVAGGQVTMHCMTGDHPNGADCEVGNFSFEDYRIVGWGAETSNMTMNCGPNQITCAACCTSSGPATVYVVIEDRATSNQFQLSDSFQCTGGF